MLTKVLFAKGTTFLLAKRKTVMEYSGVRSLCRIKGVPVPNVVMDACILTYIVITYYKQLRYDVY